MPAPSRVRPIGRPSRSGPAILALGLLLHAAIVVSILRQPLDVNGHPPSARSVVWPLYNDTIHRPGPGADFFALYHAAVSFQRGESPYGPREEPRTTPYFFPFRYLPIVGQTLGRLFLLFPPLVAYRIWILILEALLGTVLLLIGRRFGPGPLRWFAVGALLLSSPYFLELHMGQFTFATVALVAIGLLLLDRARPAVVPRWQATCAAFAFSIAVLLKSFPLAMAPALLRRRRFWPSLGLAVFLLVATSLPYFLVHPDDWRIFYQTNFADFVVHHSSNVGLLAFSFVAFRIFGFDPTQEQWTQFARDFRLLVLGLTALIVFFSRNRSVAIGGATLVAAHFLTFAQVWEHHMSGVLLAGTLLLVALQEQGEGPDPGGAAHPGGSRGSVRCAGRAQPEIALTVIALLLLALPTPFALLDHAKDPTVFDPSGSWSIYTRALMVLTKTGPTLLLYVAGLISLLRPGFGRPWPGRTPARLP